MVNTLKIFGEVKGMFQNTYRLLTFVDSAGKIHGRKKLQKMVHLLKSAGTAFQFKYRYHHYGPYSSELQSEMDQLVKQGYLYESQVNGAYQYTITENGLKFKTMLETDGGYSFELNEDVFKKLLERDTQFLEMFSTYVFLIESGDTQEEAKQKAKQLKPHLADCLDEAMVAYEAYIVH